jgi:hypothetical protein
MSNFWPKGIEISDTQSPMQILETAQEEWHLNSDGLLTLVLQGTKSKAGNDMIIVHAKHIPSNRTVTLFSVVYRHNTPYPATIQPKDDDLPNYLKKEYNKSGALTDVVRQLGSERVSNTWVSDEPSEFRKKLEQVFNLSVVKSDIVNLLSTSREVTDDDRDEPAEEFTREDEE